MNKYKLVSLVLAVALLASLVTVMKQRQTPAPVDTASVVFKNIYDRRSIRFFKDRVLSPAQVDTLLRAAMAAPTGRDRRPWRFVVVDQRAALDTMGAHLPYAAMLIKAPMAIVVCGERTPRVPEAEDLWPYDCSAATENLLLMAQAMGLGAVWTAVHPYPDRVALVKRVLRLPENVIPLNVVPVGYPDDPAQPKRKYDRDNIHYNTW